MRHRFLRAAEDHGWNDGIEQRGNHQLAQPHVGTEDHDIADYSGMFAQDQRAGGIINQKSSHARQADSSQKKSQRPDTVEAERILVCSGLVLELARQ